MNQQLATPAISQNSSLPTSRFATQGRERSVLAVLRGLTPRRQLTLAEAFIIAELQASRLLELAGRPSAPIPSQLILELPRIRVRGDADLPVSGSAHWNCGHWQITICTAEPVTRQRFSLAHELAHVIWHPHVTTLFANSRQGELAADYFAACLLMPKREVLRLWTSGEQSLSTLSHRFAVSPMAMARRLEHLGLRPRRQPKVLTPVRRHGYYVRRSVAVLNGEGRV